MSKLNQFNRIAGYYDWVASIVFWGAIRRSQCHFLAEIPEESNILILGGGTGWILNEVARHSPGSHIYFIEASELMIEKARQHSDNPNITFIHGTENDIPDVRFDAVATFYFLDLFSDLEINTVIGKIKLQLKPSGVWLVTDFLNSSWWHRIALKLMYAFFRLTCGLTTTELPQWTYALERASLKKVKSTHYFGGFIATSVFKQNT